jgi:intein/homing endonuclease
MIPETDRAYIAGLFDGEGCVSYKQYNRKRPHNKKAYPTWQIRLEIAMTDKSVLTWIHEVLGVCRLIFPFTHVKMEGVQKILQHYAHIKMNDNVVDLKEYKEFMSLE